ncbi:MAG: histidinol dehydrogenase [Thermoanaerobaculia bacterium]|nr:histidinol dehydrogenase [Thermoanaerobaculia bacterium]
MTLRRVKLASRRGERELERLVARGKRVVDRKTLRRATRIVNEVRRKGDAAVLAFVRELDGVKADEVAGLRQPLASRESLEGQLAPELLAAMERAIAAVDDFHAPQVHAGYETERDGVWLEERRRPLRRVGVYVPGGRFPYPSTVIMTVVPARLAGVEEIVVATPPRASAASPALRWVLNRLGVQEVWGMGGAHAVAALAYGTETVRRVDKILGPGNVWVNAAKRVVAGDVAIDGVPGPTEVVILADAGADPALVAADLIAQAEHDVMAAAILVTDDGRLARAVAQQIESQLEELGDPEVAKQALERFGLALLVEDLEEGLRVAERIAPEHLQLMGEGPEAAADRVSSAGAVVIGASTSAVFGDYVAGPSHVLPTCGSARFASALGVEDFIRRSHSIRFSAEAAAEWAEVAAVLADAEGLAAHAAAARRRKA